MWSRRRVASTNRAAAFWTDWSWSIYPLLMKHVMHELAECADNLPTIADFKCDLRAALDDRLH